MPAPDIFSEGEIDPFADSGLVSESEHPGILYATDRLPVEEPSSSYPHYGDSRANSVRVGIASIEFGADSSITWEEARQISLLKNRSTDYPLSVTGVEEFGVLGRTISPISADPGQVADASNQFAEEIERRLRRSNTRDIYIYVHGYKVKFENPLLVASELWHFLGYSGAFIAFSWPSTPRTLAYAADLEDAVNSARSLRSLVLFLSESTSVRKIHVLGYSAGTRVVTRMLADLGMYAYFLDPAEAKARVKLGNVILVGSDVDRSILGGYLIDGALRIPDSLTIYQSRTDRALGMSRRLFGRERIGQLIDLSSNNERLSAFLDQHPELRFIDVTGVAGTTTGNGHGYFRASPWVSSDVLMTLLYDLAPEQRGLEPTTGGLRLWQFPPDYLARLRSALNEARSD